MPRILLWWHTTSEADVGGMTVRLNLPNSIPFNVVAVRQMTEEGRSDKIASDMEVSMKQMRII
jgi:hypothetical protein